jgi:TIR domain
MSLFVPLLEFNSIRKPGSILVQVAPGDTDCWEKAKRAVLMKTLAGTKMNGQIFISYRRDDSAASAGRLFDRLSNHFPSNQIFMDVDSIDLGENFVNTIRETVGSCDVLIAVIGKGWLTSCDQEGQRRLDNPDDFVRLEIATALKRDIRVIPVPVDGALMPQSRGLPDDLKALVHSNALLLSHDRFRTDSERLESAVKGVLEKTTAERRGRLEAERRETEKKERLETECRQKEE